MVSSFSSTFTLNSLNQNPQLFPINYSLFLLLSPPNHARELSPLVLVPSENNASRVVAASAKLSATRHDEPRAKTLHSPRTVREENGFGFRSSRHRGDDHKEGNNNSKLSNIRKSARKNQTGSSKREEREKERENGKGSKESKVDSPEVQLRVGLDMCSKKGDAKRAIELFDWAQRQGIKLGQYHYTVLLYLCSSAAVGFVRPAKSGTGSRSLDGLDSSEESPKTTGLNDDGSFDEKEKINWFCNGPVKRSYRLLDGLSNDDRGEVDPDEKGGARNPGDRVIRVDGELKRYARERGFEIFEKMRSEGVPVNEAALTSVARMAMSVGDGDMAFDTVKQMKSLGINPRLRSYGPALSAFCNGGDIDKAFDVEGHMLENGVYPEEPELQALLRVSVGAGKGDRVYYLLHKLRSAVRKVSASTADLIVGWFESKAGSRVGKAKWDERAIKEAIANGGGGWHGQGWLGRGKWSVLRTNVGTDGLCRCCGEKLAIIDLDPKETENFAESVASIAIQREKHSNFQKFQKWLDYYGPFEAVVDGANIGLFSQKRFMPSKINAVVNGIRQKLPSKKWPLIVLHNRRLVGPKMNEPINRALFDKWRNADAIYATPTGSNDDWYWLYAAIKFKSFLVTNDEMRDHTFQLLGNDFFPRWKERHQVRFTFTEAGLEFLMPPPCSVVIQESENGHWHIPISSGDEYEAERPWLCIMRAKSRLKKQDSKPKSEGLPDEIEVKAQRPDNKGDHKRTSHESEKTYKNLREILSGSMMVSDHRSIIPKIESAEEVGGCTIDFQI